ncbi:MAG: AAA family ATPase [bacterium]|nr:AAA family ATPase [bacterium]
MPWTIAVGGKGGVGKTTISGLIIRYLLDVGKTPILAVDADANSNLNEILGVAIDKTIGSLREEVLNEIKNLPLGVFKENYLEYKIQEALVEEKGYDLLVMGRTEGPKCYCYANTILRKYMDVIASNYNYIVMDNAAGLEHLSRGTTRDVDVLFIVSDPTIRGVRTAGRIKTLIQELKLSIEKVYLLINRVKNGLDEGLLNEIKNQEIELAGTIPEDSQVLDEDVRCSPIFALPKENKVVVAVGEILKKTMEKFRC